MECALPSFRPWIQQAGRDVYRILNRFRFAIISRIGCPLCPNLQPGADDKLQLSSTNASDLRVLCRYSTLLQEEKMAMATKACVGLGATSLKPRVSGAAAACACLSVHEIIEKLPRTSGTPHLKLSHHSTQCNADLPCGVMPWICR